ncbi:calcium uniporter protein 4, mitochondrial-like [Cornus florida]|uniref:calcium uniporter protein 4, mitochondrial-like n=1 Tax=Cornus florida TaxID=4283 RepID=UPI0028987205|nr:calcium uniporter protein 4, mitochondrial-like [Cornus florida]
MALRRTLAKRLLSEKRETSSTVVTLQHSPISNLKTLVPPNAARTSFHREFLTSPDSADTGFFRRFLQRRGMNQATRLPDFLSVPIGDKLSERLKSMNINGDHLRLDGLSPPPPPPATADSESLDGISVLDARKILRVSLLEKLRTKLRQIPVNSISYSEFVRVCVDGCSNHEQGLEFAKTLDESGNVIVLGNVVFLRPDQVAKSMETIIYQSIASPNDPRRKELEQMEEQKATIDRKAESLVRGELYCGLGFLTLQTLGFMRLTFWELTWDVMEPICFFVTSLHFALAYAFFLRTSKEPSFEGYFRRRFRTKQEKLMKVHNFNIGKYNKLCKLFYPNYYDKVGHFPASNHAGGAVFNAIHC